LWPAYYATFTLALGQWAAGIAVPLQVEDLGGSAVDAGAIAAIRFGLAAFLAIPFGAVADSWGIRRTVALGVTGAAVVNLIPILATFTGSQIPLYVWAVLSGVTGSMVGPALGAWLVGTAPESRRGSAFGWLTFSGHTGAALGPAVGGFAFQQFGPNPTYLFASIAALGALVAPFVMRSSVRTRVQLRQLPTMVRTVARDRVILGCWVVAVAVGLPWGAVAGLFPLFGTSVGLSAGLIGLLLASQSVVNGASRIPLGRLLDRRRIPALATVGSASIYALLVAVLGLQTTAWAIGGVLVVSVLAIAFTVMLIQIKVSERAPAELRATALGGYSATLSAGLGVGPLLAGAVASGNGYPLGFGVVAIAGIAWAVAGAAVLVRARRG
jgi:MFS family permease